MVRLKMRDLLTSTANENSSFAEAQSSLYLLGYDLGNYGALKVGIDSDFGKKTKAEADPTKIHHPGHL